jgi:hypothetical protein
MGDMQAELDNMFQLAPFRGRFLPPGGVTDRMFCFKNGVLKIRLKTGKISPKPRIEIE